MYLTTLQILENFHLAYGCNVCACIVSACIIFYKVLKVWELEKIRLCVTLITVTNTFFETTVFEIKFETTVEIFRDIRPPIFRCKNTFEASVFETSVFEANSSYQKN